MNRALRAAYLAAGFLFVGIGLLGRLGSSERFYRWLLDHRAFGPRLYRVPSRDRRG